MADQSTWKTIFDRLERTVGVRVNDFVRSEEYAAVVALAQRAQRELAARGEHTTRKVLHSLNLPAGSDVNRLLVQIGKLEREVRELRRQIADKEPTPKTKEVGRSATPVRSGGRPRAAPS